MKKYLSVSKVLLLTFIAFSLGACSDNDNNDGEVSSEWKEYQADWAEKIREETRKGLFSEVKSDSRDGSVYWRTSDYIDNNMKGDFDKEGPDALPKTKAMASGEREIFETDILEIRYEGWYYNLNDKKIMFSSTERGIYGNNAKTHLILVNSKSDTFLGIDGIKTILLSMKVGEERIVCIPYQLGYGLYGTSSIPGYTTLFYDIKILRNVTADNEAKLEE